MRGVTLTEQMFRRSGVPAWLRPAIGGLAVGGLALVTPQVLSSGHAALSVGIDAPYSLTHIALLFVLKSVASAVSIGSGFRGGLFFASLFLGAMLGKLFHRRACHRHHRARHPADRRRADRHGAAWAVAVVGGPLTMGFLGVGDHRQPAADRRRSGRLRDFGDHRAPHLRLLVRYLALPSARRGHPQRRRYAAGCAT